MLPICFGAATRLGGFLLDAEKAYRATARFGVATDTADADGAVTERVDEPRPTGSRPARCCSDGFSARSIKSRRCTRL